MIIVIITIGYIGIGYFGIGYIGILSIMALGILALGRMALGILSCNHVLPNRKTHVCCCHRNCISFCGKDRLLCNVNRAITTV